MRRLKIGARNSVGAEGVNTHRCAIGQGNKFWGETNVSSKTKCNKSVPIGNGKKKRNSRHGSLAVLNILRKFAVSLP